jgi:hypothetical protein
MGKSVRKIFICPGVLLITVISCQRREESAQGEWIRGTEKEKLKTTERHFRGMDVAMIEIGYRYQELYGRGRIRTGNMPLIRLKKLKSN